MLAINLFIFVSVMALGALAEVIYVDGNSGVVGLPCGGLSAPCSTLKTAVESAGNSFIISIQFLSESMNLGDLIRITNVTEFQLKGMEGRGTLITCSSRQKPGDLLPGLVLVELNSIEIADINITGCGTVREYILAVEYSFSYMAAIHLHRCNNVNISDGNFTENNGSGVAIIEPQTGRVSIVNSTFSKNSVPVAYRSESNGGAGLYVRATGGSSFHLQLSRCTFEFNRATNTFFYTFLTVFNQPHNGTGRGGGVDIVIWCASRNQITITNCTFRHNVAYLGGGLAIQINGDSHHNQILVQESRFEQNGCMEGARSGSGGGAHIGYGFGFEDTSALYAHAFHNTFHIERCVFRENCADLGGGMTFFTTRSDQLEYSLTNVFMLDSCEWTGNMAYIGAAVDISPHSESRTRAGFLPSLMFRECNFTRNHIIFRQLDFNQSFGLGVLFSSLLNVDFVDSVTFEANEGSALVIVNAVANFSNSDALFVGNTGVQGGAISITGISALLVGPGRKYNFTGNHATDRGGAIYNYLIDNHDFTVSETCFIYYVGNSTPVSLWNTSFYFINNTAGEYGHSIFSSSILSCAGDEDENTSTVFKTPHVFHFDSRKENHIATEASSFHVKDSVPFQVIPGEQHKLGIEMADENGQQIKTIFRASMLNTSNSGVYVDDAFSCVSGNIIQMTGETKSSGVLLLETISSRKNSIAVNISLLPCPPGFKLVDRKCTCSVNMYSAIVGCDFENFHSRMKVGYWAGYIDDDKFVTGICPLSFCGYNGTRYEREVPLPRNTSPSYLDEYICGPRRTGILCGGCKPGYSVFYHSPSYDCRHSQYCEWGWVFYILSELLPVTAIFVAVLALNVSFTSGRLNGFILFSQLLDSVIVNGSGVVQYPRVLSILSWGYQLIYGLFSMEFFNIEPLSFCLWEGATVLDVLAFRYVTLVYAFLLVLVTLLFLKYCGHTFARRKLLRITTFKTSIIHGLSAFIVLCYSQTTKTSIYILIYATLRGKYGQKESLHVFLHGDTGLYSIEHLPYAVPALLCLVTITIIPPALLLFYPSIYRLLALCKVSDKAMVLRILRMIPINKLKPFLDSFQSCFKDYLRFFAGVYFVYRWIGLMAFALVPAITGFYISLGAIYVILLMLHAVFQPYTNKVNNIIDGCLFANLALIYIIAAYNYLLSQGLSETYTTQATYIATMASIQLLLIYAPIIGIGGYLAFLLYQTVKCKPTATTRSAFSSYLCEASSQRPMVSSSDIHDLIAGPEEFPPRMLEADYDEYNSELTPVNSTSSFTGSSNQLVETYL